MKTSKVQGHIHTFKKGAKRTSIDAGHSHAIKKGKSKTEPSKDGHTHSL